MILRFLVAIIYLTIFINAQEIYKVVEEFGDESNSLTIQSPQQLEKKTIISNKEENISKNKASIENSLQIEKKPQKKHSIKVVKHKTIKNKKNIKTKLTKLPKNNKKIVNSKVKLVIIIDDISHRYQLNEIKRLKLNITPSIFPPNKMNMKNHLLARGLKHYMVHLPLESGSRQMNKMHKTIFTYYTKKQIENRIKEVRRLFPTAKYLNNHTGSKFSANYSASKKLYQILIKNKFIFVDSRTSDHTKFPKIAKEFGRRYLKADLFIDNKLNTNYIIKQINKGIALAKKRGYAVLIGHPHQQTFQALKQLKHKLESINLIYIDQL